MRAVPTFQAPDQPQEPRMTALRRSVVSVAYQETVVNTYHEPRSMSLRAAGVPGEQIEMLLRVSGVRRSANFAATFSRVMAASVL